MTETLTGSIVKFDYFCSSCKLLFERQFKPGKDKARQKCPRCGKMVSKYFGTISTVTVFKGGGFPSNDMKFNKDMTRRNEEAGRRMRKNRPPVRIVAHQYPDGSVREVNK